MGLDKDFKNLGENILISAGELEVRAEELAKQISSDYKNSCIDEVILICILKGSVLFMSDLAKKLTIPNVELEFMRISSYENNTTSGEIIIKQDLDIDIKNKHIIIIEDIIDTGKTLSYLLNHLNHKEPASIKLCTLLDKPSRRIIDVKVDYIGFTIEDLFVVGYGLDYMQKYRNLPYVAHVL